MIGRDFHVEVTCLARVCCRHANANTRKFAKCRYERTYGVDLMKGLMMRAFGNQFRYKLLNLNSQSEMY